MAALSLSSSSSPVNSVPSLSSAHGASVIQSSQSVSTTDTSGVWQYFNVGEGRDAGYNLCTVPRCGRRIKTQSRGQTSNMISHLLTNHKITIQPRTARVTSASSLSSSSSSRQSPNIAAYLKPSLSSDAASANRPPPTKQQRQQWTLMLLRMAVDMNVSFRSLCECGIFREFLEEELGWRMPSRMTLSRLLPAYHAHLVGRLREQLLTVDSLCITTDSTFLTRQQVPYICITGHWIDRDWQLHDEVLAVFLAEQSETAEFISTKLKNVLENQLGITRKLHCITTDEGQNFLAAVDMLKNSELVRESLRCACHRLQLTMRNAYKHSECIQLKQLLDKCSKIVNVFKTGWASTKRDILARYQLQHVEGLKKDVAELEKEAAAHATRAAAIALDKSNSRLRMAGEVLAEDGTDSKQEESEQARENQELNDLLAVDNSSSSLRFDDDSEREKKDDLSDNDNEADLDEAEIERLVSESSQMAARVQHDKAFVDYIFNKRALIQRAGTRWLTYVYVVERCVVWHKPLMNALMEIRSGQQTGRMRNVDWNNLHISDQECNILTTFIIVGRAIKQVIVALEGSKHCTIGLLLRDYHRLREYMTELIKQNEISPILKMFCQKTLDNCILKFTASVDKAAMTAVMLDPRFKHVSFLSRIDATKCIEALRQAFTDLEVEMGRLDTMAESLSSAPRKRQRVNNPDVYTDFSANILDAASPVKGHHLNQTELDRYLAHPHEPERSTDPLAWWKLYAPKYPKVAILARRYLAIPASSASSERLFSQLKLRVPAARQGLDPDTVCMLLFVNCHMGKLQVSNRN